MNKEITEVDVNDIISIFEINGKKYCALIDSQNNNEEEIYFAQISDLDENTCVLSNVLESELEAVKQEFEKQENTMDILNAITNEEGEI